MTGAADLVGKANPIHQTSCCAHFGQVSELVKRSQSTLD